MSSDADIVNKRKKLTDPRYLRRVNEHEGFRFYTDQGCPTGITASSLKDFQKKLEKIDIESIDFHFARRDFRRWIQIIIGDIELSNRVNKIPQELRGEKLRKEIILIVKKRIIELKTTKKYRNSTF